MDRSLEMHLQKVLAQRRGWASTWRGWSVVVWRPSCTLSTLDSRRSWVSGGSAPAQFGEVSWRRAGWTCEIGSATERASESVSTKGQEGSSSEEGTNGAQAEEVCKERHAPSVGGQHGMSSIRQRKCWRCRLLIGDRSGRWCSRWRGRGRVGVDDLSEGRKGSVLLPAQEARRAHQYCYQTTATAEGRLPDFQQVFFCLAELNLANSLVLVWHRKERAPSSVLPRRRPGCRSAV